MNWPTTKIGQVAQIDRDGISPESIVNGALYVGLENIESGGRLFGVKPVANGELASTKFQFTRRHLLFGKLRPYLAKIAVPNFEGICSTDILPVLPGKKLDRQYLAHFLRQPSMVAYAASQSDGANLPRLSPKKLAGFDIPLPPIEEQRRIASILDLADVVINSRRACIAKLEVLAQSAFIEMFGDPAENPKSFEACKLGDIINFIGGSQPPKSTFLYEDGPNRTRFVQIRDFRTDEYKTYVPTALAKRPFSEDDVMIGRYGPPVFQIFRGLSGTYNVALMKAAPKAGVLNDFVFYLLKEERLHTFVVANSERTAGQSGVNLELLEKYPAFKPPLQLQGKFSLLVQSIKHQHDMQQRQSGEIERLISSLQHRAFRGEL
jgi:type I restriction enzyme S subunit